MFRIMTVSVGGWWCEGRSGGTRRVRVCMEVEQQASLTGCVHFESDRTVVWMPLTCIGQVLSRADDVFFLRLPTAYASCVVRLQDHHHVF